MGVGFISLISVGIEDLYLTGDPQITFYKVMYRRTTEFSMVDYPIKISGDPQPGETHMIDIGHIADKLNRVSLIVDVPTPELLTIPPTISNIQQIGNNYNLNLTFPSTIKPSDPVTYDKLFNDNPESVGSQITTATKNLNTEYESRLDVLDYYSNTYSISKNRHLGKYIAIDASNIDWDILGQNIDHEGYVLLTPQKTRELYHSPDQIINLTESSFMYYPLQSDAPYNTSQPIDTLNLSTPISLSIPPIPTRLPTIDRLMKVYPRIVPGYTEITSFQDFLNITDINTSRYHIMIPINYLRQVQQRNIYIRRVFMNSLDTKGASTDTINQYLEQVKDTNLSNIIQQSAIFNNFDYNEMLDINLYETGIYLFEINPAISELNYPSALTQILDTGRLSISTDFIDSSTVGSSVKPSLKIEFNRYDINDNALYDPLWELENQPKSTIRTLDLNGQTTSGFLLVNVEDLDKDPINQNVIDINNLVALINPRYISSNDDRIGFAPYKITRIWNNSIVKNVQIIDQSTSNINNVQLKVNNLVDGDMTLVKLFEDIYMIPNIINSFNLSSLLQSSNLSIQSLNGLHSLLIAMMEDTLNTQNQARNYYIQNIKLYNSIDIRIPD
jgi:hypothetical protein